MKLISEAALDDQFNKQMMKIQDAIHALEQIAGKLSKDGTTTPIRSQRLALEVAIEDLHKIISVMFVL
jgi:hypothetical protein